ncbi:ArsR/SmtB family transcription factor [Microbacterium laevaniformans]|uniref:ArsR/SmtB family transcription factor n=1 Tax=Microbacterium laevaniformans TaxID=36807 RepID=UPI00362B74C9
MHDREHLSSVFEALAHPVRLELVALLAADRGGPGLGVTALAAKAEISRFSASFHLEKLRAAGLVRKVKVGTSWRHFLADTALDTIDDWLLDVLDVAAAS